ncbi:MAG: FHA domain-containing protein, partial [SAR324 cluster bacterium]|nr:FHA domain-containing protein [SAR324 cluster bacterium]
MPSLRYLDDAGRLRVTVLDAKPFLVGRAESCQLTFDSDMISREHLRIDVADDGRFRARDLDSRNKTFVNGELIQEILLSGGDVIRVGDRVVEFVDDAASPRVADLSFLTPDRAEPADCEWIK